MENFKLTEAAKKDLRGISAHSFSSVGWVDLGRPAPVTHR